MDTQQLERFILKKRKSAFPLKGENDAFLCNAFINSKYYASFGP